MTLYLKYRPQKIEELNMVSVRETLGSILKSKSIPHAFLFVGPRGTGKTSGARILAKIINKDESVLDSPDVVEIDAASNRGIDEIRSLRDSIALAPMQAKFKVYIIDEAHMLTPEAFNALLKTLEEPPEHAVFVLCTTEGQKLPETVVSRCTVVKFNRPSLEEIMAKLKMVTERENIKVEEPELKKIAQTARGSFRDAIKLLEAFQLTGKTLDTFDSQNFLEILSDTKAALDFISKKHEEGVNWREFIENCISELRDHLLVSHDKKIIELIHKFETAYIQTKDAAVPQLPLEILVIETGGQIPKAVSTPTVSPPTAKPRNEVENLGGDKRGGKFSLSDIESRWTEILKHVKPHNHSVEALLRSTRPVEFDGDVLKLEVFYKFHKDKLETDKCKGIVEASVGEVMGDGPVRLVLVLGERTTKKEELSGQAEVEIIKAAEEIFKVEAV